MFKPLLGKMDAGIGLGDSCIGKLSNRDLYRGIGSPVAKGMGGLFYIRQSRSGVTPDKQDNKDSADNMGTSKENAVNTQVPGVRVWPNAMGYLVSLYNPGDYGRAILTAITCPYMLFVPLFYPQCNWWKIITPAGSTHVLDPAIHTVEEHSDGTISVTPGIVTSMWRGTLVKGVFTATTKSVAKAY